MSSITKTAETAKEKPEELTDKDKILFALWDSPSHQMDYKDLFNADRMDKESFGKAVKKCKDWGYIEAQGSGPSHSFRLTDLGISYMKKELKKKAGNQEREKPLPEGLQIIKSKEILLKEVLKHLKTETLFVASGNLWENNPFSFAFVSVPPPIGKIFIIPPTNTSPDANIEKEIEKILQQIVNIGKTQIGLPPETSEKTIIGNPVRENLFLSYREQILLELAKADQNIMLQSNLIEKIGISKSQISIEVNHLKDDGKVEKIKNGKKNLIKLTEKGKLEAKEISEKIKQERKTTIITTEIEDESKDETKKSVDSKIPAEIVSEIEKRITDEKASRAERIIYALRDGKEISLQELEERTGLNRYNLYAALQEMKKGGWVTVKKRKIILNTEKINSEGLPKRRLTHEEKIEEVLRKEGGKISQKALHSKTGIGANHIAATLTKMEKAGKISREYDKDIKSNVVYLEEKAEPDSSFPIEETVVKPSNPNSKRAEIIELLINAPYKEMPDKEIAEKLFISVEEVYRIKEQVNKSGFLYQHNGTKSTFYIRNKKLGSNILCLIKA